MEVEEYKGLEVEFVHGRAAKLSVYKDGSFQKTVSLPDDKEQLRSLMKELGFEKITDEDVLTKKKAQRR